MPWKYGQGIFGDFDMFEFEGLDPTYQLNVSRPMEFI